jgi:hypothetical protein
LTANRRSWRTGLNIPTKVEKRIFVRLASILRTGTENRVHSLVSCKFSCHVWISWIGMPWNTMPREGSRPHEKWCSIKKCEISLPGLHEPLKKKTIVLAVHMWVFATKLCAINGGFFQQTNTNKTLSSLVFCSIADDLNLIPDVTR